MLNQILIVGRLTSDLEIKEVNDKKVTHITIACPRSYKNAEGVYETDFIPITLWNVIAENTAEYCHKGDIISVKGRIQSNGNDIELMAEKVISLSSKKSEENESN